MHPINWDDYRYVLALHLHGSLVDAARSLGVNETTVGRRLAQIERSLGTRLFERERGRVRATEAGARLAERLVAVGDTLDQLHESVVGADREIAGTVRVTAYPSIANRVIVPRLPELLARHERLEVELLVDASLLGIARARDADIAIRGVRTEADPEAITRKLGELEYGVYCHRDLLATGVPSDWIAYESRLTRLPQAQWLEEQLALEGQVARTRVNDGETLLRCVLNGLGKTVLTEALARSHPELARLETDRPLPSRELWMLMHPSYRETRRIEVVVEWLDGVVGEFLEGEG